MIAQNHLMHKLTSLRPHRDSMLKYAKAAELVPIIDCKCCPHF